MFTRLRFIHDANAERHDMGEKTEIAWCDSTFNPWIGCQKVAVGCEHCYAEADFDKRRKIAKWGPHGTRIKTSEANWRKPLKWNREAQEAGERRRVFCASLADVFEDWSGLVRSSRTIVDEPCPENGFKEHRFNPVLWHRSDIGVCEAGQTTVNKVRNERLATLDDLRCDLFALIDATPHLDWLVLTKRPENIRRMWKMVVEPLLPDIDPGEWWRQNCWLGTSIATRADAERNISFLRECRHLAPVLFLSVEPLVEDLGELDLSGIDWVIVGGESGHGARPCHPDWVRNIREQCVNESVPMFFKQWGEFVTPMQMSGALYEEMDGDTLTEEFYRVGKKRAGRLLDYHEYPQFPKVQNDL